jgi:hypothetical protein
MGKDKSSKMFVNGRKASHKSSKSKGISSLPDVAKTPSTPGHIPVPYPNIAKSSDNSKRAKTVKISRKKIRSKKS